MRKTLIALITAAALTGAAAQTAAADVPATYTYYNEAGRIQGLCTTDWQFGSYGAFGANGYYIDGCTVSLTCPAAWHVCRVETKSKIETLNKYGEVVTMNQRIWLPTGWRDDSCTGYYDTCHVVVGRYGEAIRVGRGNTVSVQCNGVRQGTPQANWARNTCWFSLYRV